MISSALLLGMQGTVSREIHADPPDGYMLSPYPFAGLRPTLVAIPMSTLLLIDRAHPECVTCGRAGAGPRLSAYIHAARLDRELAAGASPDSSAALSLRAQKLIGTGARWKLAKYVGRLADDTPPPLAALVPGVPICWGKLIASRQTLRELAERLVSHRPVDARGVARVSVLLAASDGPVYEPPAVDDLESALRATIAALEPDAWESRGSS